MVFLKRIISIYLLKTLGLICLCMPLLLSDFAIAKKKKRQASKLPVQASLVVDGRTGRVLHQHNAFERIYPASLAKVMTCYLIFESLQSGKLTLNKKLKVSKHASKAPPLKLYLKAGQTITVKDAINGLIIKSANDVARVVAENIAGSEKRFAKLMTVRAKQLGMKNTNFANASGLHDARQRTTAVDLAKLAIAIKRDFPEYYPYFAKTSFAFRGKTINGHNKLTANYPWAEGLKTGYINAAGCNLITTATKNNKSLVGVVIGGKSSSLRDKKMRKLLDGQFARGVKNKKRLAKKGAKKRAAKKKSRKIAAR